MIWFLFLAGICGAVMAGVYIAKVGTGEDGKWLSGGVSSLLMGLCFAVMVSEGFMAMDREWRETLEDAEFLYYFMHFAGICLIAWGISQMAYAVIVVVRGIQMVQRRMVDQAAQPRQPANSPQMESPLDREPAAKPAAVLQETVNVSVNGDRIVCPRCGADQNANRKCCFECGARFDVQV